ncbi:MAG TPA: hypothetical protein VHZ24_22700 [Pirellulales bacterium]|jgi:hypothetical protein|nr:hypothetical protein [Pirellulales bacterium]
MRFGGIATTIVVCAGALAAARAEPAVSAAAPTTVSTRQTTFSIPFKVESARSADTAPVEVQLHVSSDRGASWRLAAKVNPSAGRFTYRSAGDGEYWFLVRTVDPRGRLRPESPPLPELKVIVDTKIPTLELEANRGNAGEVRARWRAADANLRRDSLKLSYQPLGSRDGWQPVAIDALQTQSTGDAFRGESTWWPESSSVPIAIRVEISDQAGNKTYSQAEVAPQASPAGDPLVDQLPPGEPVGTPEPAGASSRAVSLPAGSSLTEARHPPSMPTAFPRSDAYPPASAAMPVPLPPVQAEELPEGVARRESSNSAALPPSADIATTTAGKQIPADQVPVPQTVDSRIEPSPPTMPATTDVATSEHKPELQLADSSKPAMFAASSSATDLLPAGVHPRMVNRLRFELEYDISAVGSDGICKVELWGTRDGGRSWRRFSIDDDSRSPLVATVDGEGLYGFRMVIETSSGLRSPEPHDGELPELWVGVDTSKPTARLLPDEIAADGRTGELTIRWEANDPKLAARPVTLLFGASPSGPWSTIAAGLENTGRYVWRLDRRAADKVYLRLEVRDEAGNVAIDELTDPVSIERARPQGRILNVRPIADAADF